MKSISLSLLLISLWSCSNGNEPQKKHQNLHDIYVSTYINGYDTEKLSTVSSKPTLEIYVADKKFMGHSGCNTIQGSLKIIGDSINFTSSPMMTTLMICEWDSLEQAYIQALEKTQTYQFENNELWFYHNNEIVMKLKKVD